MDAKTLWARFNLSPDEPAKLLAAQNGLCAVCGRPLELGKPSVCLDHNHKTGLVNGVLCFLCNRALGLLGDDINRLMRAIMYLQAPPAPAALGENRFGKIGRGTNKSKKSKTLFARGEGSGGVVYRCGCRECAPRPKKYCPVHAQPIA